MGEGGGGLKGCSKGRQPVTSDCRAPQARASETGSKGQLPPWQSPLCAGYRVEVASPPPPPGAGRSRMRGAPPIPPPGRQGPEAALVSSETAVPLSRSKT